MVLYYFFNFLALPLPCCVLCPRYTALLLVIPAIYNNFVFLGGFSWTPFQYTTIVNRASTLVSLKFYRPNFFFQLIISYILKYYFYWPFQVISVWRPSMSTPRLIWTLDPLHRHPGLWCESYPPNSLRCLVIVFFFLSISLFILSPYSFSILIYLLTF